MKKVLTIFTDGAARGNPGKAGVGIVINGHEGGRLAQYSFFIGEGTNNQAEYFALISALVLAKELLPHYATIACYADSLLMVQQLSKKWQVKNEQLFRCATYITRLLSPYTSFFYHIPREKNTHADMLANKGIDTNEPLPPLLATLHRNLFSFS